MCLLPKVSTHAIGVDRVTEKMETKSWQGKSRVRENERVCYLVQVSDVDLKRELVPPVSAD